MNCGEAVRAACCLFFVKNGSARDIFVCACACACTRWIFDLGARFRFLF